MSVAEVYEAQRQARIAQNKRQLAELGLLAACDDLRQTSVHLRPKKLQRREPSAPRVRVDPAQLRRSGRSEGKPAPIYNDNVLDEALAPRRSKSASKRNIVYSDTIEGHPQESYTEAQLALLGGCEKEWELFVDGYDANGQRLYDRVDGRTCHQCRQKTMGKRTNCSNCQSLTGVFCGDCLYMRYGENVEEANANPGWTCPHCRDHTLCNCSQHRTRLGWGPTGSLYRKVTALGFKSVAHYLVETHLVKDTSPAPVEANLAAEEPPVVPPAPSTPPLQSEEEAASYPFRPEAAREQPAKACNELPATSPTVEPVASRSTPAGKNSNGKVASKKRQLVLDEMMQQRKPMSPTTKVNKTIAAPADAAVTRTRSGKTFTSIHKLPAPCSTLPARARAVVAAR